MKIEDSVKFNKKLYSQKVIKAVVQEFDNLADIKVNSQGLYITVSFANALKEVKDVIQDEFGNYVLYLMKQSITNAKQTNQNQ